jgi:calcineurin-like phosphoesterase family protein
MEGRAPVRWFISDTHFCHENVIEYSGRPFKNVLEMDLALMSNWNTAVAPTDLVYFVGDFGMASKDRLKAICQMLNGTKICVMGNHDGSTRRMEDIGFAAAVYNATIKIEGNWIELVHIPPRHPPERLTLHGHVHQLLPFEIVHNRLNLSVEVTGYHPVSEPVIASMIRKARTKSLARLENKDVPSQLPDSLVTCGSKLPDSLDS